MKSLSILSIFFISISSLLNADDAFEAKVFKLADASIPYRIHSPGSVNKTKKYPLVIFFHGAGERGDDNNRQIRHGAKPIPNGNRPTGSQRRSG